MKNKPLLPACVIALAIIALRPLHAAALDWPQWQGPDRNAISLESGLLQAWPEAGPPLAWKLTGLGGGDSAPSIAAGRLFGMSIRGEDEVVWAVSEADGKELWVTRLGPAVQQAMPQSREGPACTPTVDADRLYVLGMGGSLACLQVADGRLYYRTEDDGVLLLFEPSSTEYLERGRFQQPDRSSAPAWAHPVIANGKLYVRDQDVLFCYNVKAPNN